MIDESLIAFELTYRCRCCNNQFVVKRTGLALELWLTGLDLAEGYQFFLFAFHDCGSGHSGLGDMIAMKRK